MPKSIPTLCGSIMAEPFSLGVRIHTAAYRELGLDYTFVCFGVENPELAVQAIRTLGIRGMSVSMPYKSAVMPFLDALDPAARAIGAVNTIDNRNGRLTGYNTDFIGAVRALQEANDLTGQALAILGAGGAARAIAYGAQQAGAQVTLFNRSTERGQALAAELNVDFGGSLEDFRAARFSILVNATSVGFRAPDSNPLGQTLEPHLLVMDIAFIPVRTKLLRDAEKAGCRTIAGTRMLLHQACKQIELYTEQQAPLAVMEKALLDEINRLGGSVGA
ncbi:MAG TPA: shikimate dehydrogenase [Candidatus Competibacter sp.]|nr:shikimate dehydrogenase [Candidatus Competibacteraceae bacterium]HPE71319.1 shikimate dehydrogenase [Candidatus Competibacter sp.]